MLINLTQDIQVFIFSYIPVDDLVKLRCCSSILKHIISCHSDYLWKNILESCIGCSSQYKSPNSNKTSQIGGASYFFSLFMQWRLEFVGYSIDEIKLANTWWMRYRSWCDSNFPQISASLAKPALDSDIASAEIALGQPLPRYLKLFIKFHNGQELPVKKWIEDGMRSNLFSQNPDIRKSICWGMFGGKFLR
jgi:hypothetical protein